MISSKKTLWMRGLALLLCAATLLPFVPLTAVAVETETTTTTPIMYLEHVDDGTLDDSGETKYAIVHDSTNQILMHDAVTKTTGSLEIGSIQDAMDKKVQAYYLYAKNDAGKNDITLINTSRMYFIHHNRDQALWLLRNTHNDPTATTPCTPLLGGTSAYRYAVFTKGYAPDDGSYWYTPSDDADATISLQPNRETLVLNKATSQNIYFEFFKDSGTFLLYYYNSGNTIRFLGYEDGQWKQIVYANPDEAKEALADDAVRAKLMLRLYQYHDGKSRKTLNWTGAQEYTILSTATADQVSALIGQNADMIDTSRRNLPVPCSGSTPKVGCYWVDFPENCASVDSYYVELKYRNDDGTDTPLGSALVKKADRIASSGTIETTGSSSGIVSKNAGFGAIVQHENPDTGVLENCTMQVTFETASGTTTETVNIVVGMLTDQSGNPVNTKATGTYTGLTVTYQGVKIAEGFTLTVSESSKDLNYPDYPHEGSVQAGKTGTTTEEEFSKTGVANIQLSATGIPMDKGIDLIVVMDLSGSMRYGVESTSVPADEADRRIHAMGESLTHMIQTLKETADVDIRIAMSDFGDLDTHEFDGAVIDPSNAEKPFFDVDTNNAYKRPTMSDGVLSATSYEFPNFLNFVMEAGDEEATSYPIANSKYNIANTAYSGKIIPTIYTGSGEANAEAFVHVDDLDMDGIISRLKENVEHSIGTNYDVGLEYAYQLGYAIRQDNIANGLDRELVCIFMSDGAAIQYNYFSGRTVTTAWTKWLTGNADDLTRVKYTETTKPDGMVELENALLSLLKAGKLIQYDYKRDSNGVTALNDTYYYNYYPNKCTGSTSSWTFFNYMDAHGYDLDWEYLSAIAKANGITDFTYENYQDADYAKLQSLIDKLTTVNANNSKEHGDSSNPYYVSSLINPSYDTDDEYYDKCDSAAEDFTTAMKIIGVEMTWDLFAKIAYRNRNGDLDNNDATKGEVMALLRAMLSGLRNKKESPYTLSPFYYFYHPDGKNWWAEAMKGDASKLYPVINKYAYANSTDRAFGYYGDVRNYFGDDETTNDLALSGQKYIGGFRGLDMDIYTVSFSMTTEAEITSEMAETVLKNIATGPTYFFSATNKDSLDNALKAIITTISNAATRGWYLDTMGDKYDLYDQSVIRVMEYDLDSNHARTGLPNVRETVTLGVDASGNPVATSDQIFKSVTDASGKIVKEYPNVWGSDNVIRAKYFYYNANKYGSDSEPVSVRLDLSGDGVLDYTLPAESFLWIVGVIGKTEMVLEYQVYLTGSMEGTFAFEPGVTYYPTNESATLHYSNALGNECTKATVSPKYPWVEGAIVSAGFYLVDPNGNPIAIDGTKTSFSASEKVGTLQRFSLEDTSKTLSAAELLATAGLDPNLYELYDPAADYSITYPKINDHSGSWSITVGDGKAQTTYVTNYGEEKAPTNATTSTNLADLDMRDTTVYFALRPKVLPTPDVVVIDFGIPVLIDPLANDLPQLSINKGLEGLSDQNGNTFADSHTGSFGTATVEGGKVRYALSTTNGMQMNQEETFWYQGSYLIGDTTVNAASTITVIPATTIYYEDSFVTFKKWQYADNPDTKDVIEAVEVTNSSWETVGTTVDKVQGEDRPGTDVDNALGSLDADYIYGYDAAYTQMVNYSLGTARKITVDANYYGTAEFTFTGTGFDLVSLTDNTTGAILVQVWKENEQGENVTNLMVDTYYGYKYVLRNVTYVYSLYETYDQHGNKTEMYKWVKSVGDAPETNEVSRAAFPTNPEVGDQVTGVEYCWIVDENASGVLYQIPVMKVESLAYDTYFVRITAAYQGFFDHNGSGNDTFYLDVIRIYDPADDGANSEGIQDAYVKDGEGWPSYQELRNLLIDANDFDAMTADDQTEGVIYIDNTLDTDRNKTYSISEYTNFGPNNELYLAAGQAVAFDLNATGTVAAIHLALKTVSGTPSVKVYSTTGEKTVALMQQITTATDLYYDITDLNGETVVIMNTEADDGNSILSITNIKTTYQSEPEVTAETQLTVSRETARLALASLQPVVNPFADVSEGSYYYEPVHWALRNGITRGIDAAHFAPGMSCTRSQVVTFLWRAAGSPEPSASKHPFADVQAGSFYEKAVLWAVEQRITQGVDATHFGPTLTCTRGQVVTFLHRAVGCPAPTVTDHPFTDVDEKAFYHQAMLWAVENGVTTGMGADTFAPNGSCGRGQVVTFLYRVYGK